MSENRWEGVRWVVESYDTIAEAKEDDPTGWAWVHQWKESWGKPSEVFRKTSKNGSTGLPGCITTTEPVARLISCAPELVEALEKLLAADGDHMTACDQIMGATHPCTCGADKARALLNKIYGTEP